MGTGSFADWSFNGSWHRYQQLALDVCIRAIREERSHARRQLVYLHTAPERAREVASTSYETSARRAGC